MTSINPGPEKSQTYWILKYRKWILWAYALLTLIALIGMLRIKFAFRFEEFFPKGDPDLEFFQQFIESFETDDNFLLMALEAEDGDIFSKQYIDTVNSISNDLKKLPDVTSVISLANLRIPSPGLFGFQFKPILDTKDGESLSKSKDRILANERYSDNLIAKDTSAMLIIIKHSDNLDMQESIEVMEEVQAILDQYGAADAHMVGRAYFQDELSRMQLREILVSSFVSVILVSIIVFFLFRQRFLIFISLVTIAMGMILFIGLLSIIGREFNGLSALYPVLMLIVGTSDVVHIVTKYTDLLRDGLPKSNALRITVKEIGFATFLTSVTTAAGFVSLLTSRISPIQEFGINSALGVLLAYGVVITFTLAALSYIPESKFKKLPLNAFWDKLMSRCHVISRDRQPLILLVTIGALVIFGIGISKISTNYNIESNLPRNSKITDDFLYFENQFSGFRPFELAIELKGKTVHDTEVIKNIWKITERLKTYDLLGGVQSVSDVYETLGNFAMPSQEGLPPDSIIERVHPAAKQLLATAPSVLVSKDETKARITSKVNDVGADVIKELGIEFDQWVNSNIDTSIMSVTRTGTGVILDKNAEYVRVNLLQGLSLAMLIVIVFMMFLFRDIRMLFVALVPNILPLLFAAAVLGYFSIELEATISIIFTIVFGIAVDDTIHFLSKYKIALDKGLEKEEAIRATFMDTGKAIVFTTIILFFGFMVLLFSIHPPSNIIGMLISLTLVSALVGDFFIIPMLLRKLT